MTPASSFHALKRMRQRALPRVMDSWLDLFGEEQRDGYGAVLIYFGHRSLRAMESALGSHFVRQNRKYLRAYKVKDSGSGTTITCGWRTQRIGKNK